MNSIKNERITARVNEEVKDKLIVAADLLGATLNQFLVLAALEKAENIIEKNELITLSRKDTAIFFDTLEYPKEPNAKLRSAVKHYHNKI